MSDVWAPVVAGLGTLILAPVGTLWIQKIKDDRDAKSSRAATRRDIYLELLYATGVLLANVGELRMLGQANSKWFHGLHQVTKTAPAQPTQLEMLTKLHEPMDGIMKVWSRALLAFDQDEVDAVNRLIHKCMLDDLSIPATDPGSAESRIGAARREFAAFARTKIGESAVRISLDVPGVTQT